MPKPADTPRKIDVSVSRDPVTQQESDKAVDQVRELPTNEAEQFDVGASA